MFEFIKKLFSKREDEIEDGTIVLHLNEIPEWLQKELGQIKLDVSEDIKRILSDFNEHLMVLKNNILQLEKAELRNKDIPVKEIQIMEGNRKSMVTFTINFIKDIQNDEELDFDQAKEFIENFDIKLKIYNESTLRNYHVLQHFFSHEVNNIVKEIGELHKQVQKLEALLNKNDLVALRKVKRNLDMIDGINEKRGKMTSMLIELEEKKNDFEKQLEKQKNRMKSIENSPSFQKFNKLITEREEIDEKIKAYSDLLIQDFSKLDTALRKYQRISENKKLVGKYLQDSVDALMFDQDLEIVAELKELKSKIGELALKDDKEAKTLEVIKKLDRQFFNKYKQEFSELKNKRSRVMHQVNTDTTMLQYDDSVYRLKHIKKKIEYTDEQIDAINKKLEQSTIENILKDLKMNLGILTSKEIELKLDNNFEDEVKKSNKEEKEERIPNNRENVLNDSNKSDNLDKNSDSNKDENRTQTKLTEAKSTELKTEDKKVDNSKSSKKDFEEFDFDEEEDLSFDDFDDEQEEGRAK